MKRTTGDLWSHAGRDAFVVVPTNLGGVMGRGVAAQAKDRYPGLEATYKNNLLHGAAARPIYFPPVEVTNGDFLCLLPVKRDWRDAADPSLIAFGVGALVFFLARTARTLLLPDVAYLPLLGAGFGGLDHDAAGAMLDALLPDSCTLVEPDTATLNAHARTMRPSRVAGRSDPQAVPERVGAVTWRVRSEKP